MSGGLTFAAERSAGVIGKFFDLSDVADYDLTNKAGDTPATAVANLIDRYQLIVICSQDDGDGTYTQPVGEFGYLLPPSNSRGLANITRTSALPEVVVPTSGAIPSPIGKRLRGLSSGHTMLWSAFSGGATNGAAGTLRIETFTDSYAVWGEYPAGNIPSSADVNTNYRFGRYVDGGSTEILVCGYVHQTGLWALAQDQHPGAPLELLASTGTDVLGFTHGELVVLEDVP